MNDRPLQLAMRELRVQLADARVWAGIGIVGALAGHVGPFGTLSEPLPLRLSYWLLVASGSYALGTATAEAGLALLRARVPRWLAMW